MNFTPIIKEVGRGIRGARGLDAVSAKSAFAALLEGEVSDIQLGAWWLAMRIKGETPEELAAFVEAMHDTLAFRIKTERPVAVLACYNGARQLPNLTPLLAWALVQMGGRVLLHGVKQDAARVTTHDLFAALNFSITESAESTERALIEGGMAFTPLDALHPKLAALISNRWRIGVRSTPHTVTKLLLPIDGPSVRVIALTHGDYIERMGAYISTQPDARALVFRGCEGEPVLHPKRVVSVGIFKNATSHMHDWPGVTTHDLPDNCDIATTVAYIKSVIQGERPMPPWIDWLARHVHQLSYGIHSAKN